MQGMAVVNVPMCIGGDCLTCLRAMPRLRYAEVMTDASGRCRDFVLLTNDVRSERQEVPQLLEESLHWALTSASSCRELRIILQEGFRNGEQRLA